MGNSEDPSNGSGPERERQIMIHSTHEQAPTMNQTKHGFPNFCGELRSKVEKVGALQRLDGMKDCGRAWKLTRNYMFETIVHHEGAAAQAAAGHHPKTSAPTIKLGVDIHLERYVVVRQEDHALSLIHISEPTRPY